MDVKCQISIDFQSFSPYIPQNRVTHNTRHKMIQEYMVNRITSVMNSSDVNW